MKWRLSILYIGFISLHLLPKTPTSTWNFQFFTLDSLEGGQAEIHRGRAGLSILYIGFYPKKISLLNWTWKSFQFFTLDSTQCTSRDRYWGSGHFQFFTLDSQVTLAVPTTRIHPLSILYIGFLREIDLDHEVVETSLIFQFFTLDSELDLWLSSLNCIHSSMNVEASF